MAAQEFLSFILNDEEYGVPILDVREVRGWSEIRVIPNSPDYLKGVLEIRGEYVPIVDLRMRFNLTPAEISSTTVVIVLNSEEKHPLGIIVDGVSEVYALMENEIKSAPHMSVTVDDSYIKGIASVESGHLILINLEALFDVAELNRTTTEETLV
ncbi:chemotaxis protein CheW [Vibrio mexicanus]|uniref:chemotaxis protein CheW n=1 Tax=Vibrio mexicanus TaxID=1004326 RepID=UPI00063C6FEB|nr:chemotaxis protein CheW [Vibrio mexicanus]